MIHPLIRVITNKMPRRTIGLMSGTSADGLDIAYCEVNLLDRCLRNRAAATVPYPAGLREEVLQLAASEQADLSRLTALHHVLGRFAAEAVAAFCSEQKIPLSEIDLIGSHGQTLRHISQPVEVAGELTRGTLQVGEAEYLAKQLGVVTVSDFRAADLAVGGSGAPLAPIYHALRFSEKRLTKAVINIGGIANVTLLKRSGEVQATDAGPGNCLIDWFVTGAFGLSHDAGGAIAARGAINENLLQVLVKHELFQRKPPTSFDRREVLAVLANTATRAQLDGMSKEDAVATLTALTALTVSQQTMRICTDEFPSLVLVCGGGAHNQTLMQRLQEQFGLARVCATSEFGSNVDFVEAETFAYLANLAIEAEAGNLPQVTGASRGAVLGKISLP